MKHSIPVYNHEIPMLTTQQMIEVDRLMIDEFNIELIQMMENAGWWLAILAMKRFLVAPSASKNVTILAGTGGNGGGVLVCARRLVAWGFNVETYITNPDQMTPIPGYKLNILQRMGFGIHTVNELNRIQDMELIIDDIIGYDVRGDPEGSAKTMIHWANANKNPVLARDTPSGVDLTTGIIHNPTIRAEATLTLALPKPGLYHHPVKPLRGELYFGDISVPPVLYTRPSLDLEVPGIFREGDVIRID